jgi:BAG domain/IQ calmodulin-binding motif
MDSFYSHSSYSYFSSSNDQPAPPHPTNPILIPISTSSDQNSTSIPVHLPASYLAVSAVKIQSVYRGHLVRSFVRTIRSVDAERARLERLIQRQETVDAVRDVNSRERIRINEMLMRALLRLDSVLRINDNQLNTIDLFVRLELELDSDNLNVLVFLFISRKNDDWIAAFSGNTAFEPLMKPKYLNIIKK